MDIALYTLTSPLHDAKATDAVSAEFISEIENQMGFRMDFHGPDFSGYGNHDLDIIFVRTGGTEGLFKDIFPMPGGRIVLLTSGKSNSLAASMEILSYLNQRGCKGEIIHGSIEYIARRIQVLARAQAAFCKLKGQNLGVIGQPSDWLISSSPDKDRIKELLGLNLVDIPIDELIAEAAVAVIPVTDVCNDMPEALRKYSEGALKIYSALKSIIERYRLSALTLRCFDLLDTLDNTGCLALAMLNAEGIPAGCEGDVPALVTMTVGNALTGSCGFQANPSRIDPMTGEMLFAHCTVPLDMVRRYSFNTHFESGIGIAIHGEIPEGPATVFKISPDLTRSSIIGAELLSNPYERNLCRTQITLKVPEEICRDYFLKRPVGNHHIIFSGDHSALFSTFMELMPSDN